MNGKSGAGAALYDDGVERGESLTAINIFNSAAAYVRAGRAYS